MNFIYQAKPWRVVDGDTFDLFCDNGRHEFYLDRFRALGVDTCEMHDKDPAKRVLAVEGKDFTAAWFVGADQAYGNEWPAAGTVHDTVDAWLKWWPLRVESFKSDVFGRWLATVTRLSDGAWLAADLLGSGLAVPWVR